MKLPVAEGGLGGAVAAAGAECRGGVELEAGRAEGHLVGGGLADGVGGGGGEGAGDQRQRARGDGGMFDELAARDAITLHNIHPAFETPRPDVLQVVISTPNESVNPHCGRASNCVADVFHAGGAAQHQRKTQPVSARVRVPAWH